MQALCVESNRNELVRKYIPLVRSIAVGIHRRLPEQVELDDLISVGITGLIEAVDRFDSDRGASLGTFARRRIHGAIMDSLRAQDWVPRTVRNRSASIADTKQGLAARLGRVPTEREMAEKLEMSVTSYRELLASSQVQTLVSMDAPVTEGASLRLVDTLSDNENGSDGLLQIGERDIVARALNALSPREREVICLYYFHDLSLREVGEVLGVTESRACQLCSQALKRLRSSVLKAAA